MNMNLSTKAIKNSIGSNDYSNYLQNAKKYFTVHSQLVKGDQNKTNTGISQSIPNTISKEPSIINKSENIIDKNSGYTPAQIAQASQAPLLSGNQNNNKQIVTYSTNNINHFSDSNCFSGEIVREEILNWLFSLPIESRIKIATVENSWVTNMINQMFFHYKCDNKSVFQMKNTELFDDKEKEKENKSNITLTTSKYKDREPLKNKNTNSICFKSGDMSQFKEEDVYLSNLMNYFNFKSEKNSNIEMIEQILLNDIYFYSAHSNLDCMTISVRVLRDEALFKYFFQYIGSQNSFSSLIKPNFDKQTKHYYYNLPEWFGINDYHSIGKYILAYFEQAIIVKFVLNYHSYKKELKGNGSITSTVPTGNLNSQTNVQNKTPTTNSSQTKNSPQVQIHSLVNEEKLAQVFIERKNIINFLKKNYYDEEKKKELVILVNPGRIFNEISHDKEIISAIKLKDRHQEIGYRSFVSRRFASMEPFFTGKSDMDTKDKIQEQLIKNHPILFLDKTIFISLDLVWKLDYYIGKRIFEILQDMYTEKNAMELIYDLENEFSDNNGSGNTKNLSSNTKKGKKNANKNKGKTGQAKASSVSIPVNEKNSEVNNSEQNLIKVPPTSIPVPPFAKDPDYEYYVPYLDDNKNQSKSQPGNNKYSSSNETTSIESLRSKNIYSNAVTVNRNHIPTTIINLKTGEVKTDKQIAPPFKKDMALTNYYKEKLVNSYQNGNTKMIEDYMRNYVIRDIIETVVKTAKAPKINCETVESVSSILVTSNVNKIEKEILNFVDRSNVEINAQGVCNEIKEEKIEINLSAHNDKISIDDIVNYETKDEEIVVLNNSDKCPLKEEEIEANVNVIKNIKNNESNLIINPSEFDKIEVVNDNKNRKNKNQKEPKFFLYQTTKRKKENNTDKKNTNHASKPHSDNSTVTKKNTDDVINDKTNIETGSNIITGKENHKIQINTQTSNFSIPSLTTHDLNNKIKQGDRKENAKIVNSLANIATTPDIIDISPKILDQSIRKAENSTRFNTQTMQDKQQEITNLSPNTNKICSNNTSVSLNNDNLKESILQETNIGSNIIPQHWNNMSNDANTITDNKSCTYKPHSVNYRLFQKPNPTPHNNHSTNNPHNNHSTNNHQGYFINQDHSAPIIRNNYYIYNTITQVSNTNNTNLNVMANTNTQPNIENNSLAMCNKSSLTNLPPLTPNPLLVYMPPNQPSAYTPPNLLPLHSTTSVSNGTNINSISLNKYSNDFLTFVYKLHNDILNYHKNVLETLECLQEIKIFSIKFIEKLISSVISDNFLVDVYGSFASDLSIESSDIDMKIRLKNSEAENPFEFDLDDMIISIVKNFQNRNLFDSVIPIYTASVPIIKIVIDPFKIADDDNLMRLEEFKQSNYNLNYKFNKADIEKIKIDLTFLDILGNMNGNKNRMSGRLNNLTNMNLNNSMQVLSINGQAINQMSSVEYAKNIMIVYPEIKPLIHVLKRYLQIKKMNSCFNGGLSSFCLFLLILAFLKYKKLSQTQTSQHNLGRLLLDFLEFYGRIFNFHTCSVDVNLANPFVLTNEIYDSSPIIFDPLSYLNASKSSYRIDEVRESFAEAFTHLNKLKLKYEKIDHFTNSNIIYDLLLDKNI